jgi:hypothetical protein
MANIVILALRVVLALSLAGFVFVQTVIVPLVWIDMEGVELWARIAFAAIAVLFVLTLEVCAVCVWMLLTMVRRASVFSSAAFRYVDIIAWSIGAASLIVFSLGVLLVPGETAPGIVGLICGGALVIAGVALLVVVMRMLLAQAIASRTESQQLRSELDEVI